MVFSGRLLFYALKLPASSGKTVSTTEKPVSVGSAAAGSGPAGSAAYKDGTYTGTGTGMGGKIEVQITVKDGVPEVTEAAAEDPCISFTADEAVRVLFSNEGHFTDEGKGLNAAAASWFPLPFYFTKSDEV